jgi:hypothetical protein
LAPTNCLLWKPLKGREALIVRDLLSVLSYRTIAPSHSFETIVCKRQCPVVSPLGSIMLLLVPLTKELLLLLDKRSDR